MIVPVRVRAVETTHFIHRKNGVSDVVHGRGFEPVEERAFCPDHVPTAPPLVEGRVERKHDLWQK
jgi:hypothetical protein